MSDHRTIETLLADASARLVRLTPEQAHAAAQNGSVLVDTRSLAYFAFVIGTFLLLTKAAVESVRWR